MKGQLCSSSGYGVLKTVGLRRFRYLDTILAYNYISTTEKAQVSEILRRNICDLLRTDFSAFFFAQMEKISKEIGHSEKTTSDILRTFARKFCNIDFFLRILPLKVDELVMSEM